MHKIPFASLLSKSKLGLFISCYLALTAATLSPWSGLERASTSSIILDGHQHRVQSVAFAPDGKTLASAAGEPGLMREVFLWDVATHKKLATLPPAADPIAGVADSPNGGTLPMAGYDSSVTMWDTVARQARWTKQEQRSPVTSVALSADGSTVASGSMMGEGVHVWDASSGKERCKLPGTAPLALSPDGRIMAARYDRYHVQLWDLSTGTTWRSSPEVTDLTLAMAFSAHGQMLATAGFDRTIRLWDRETCRLLANLEGHEAPVLCLAFSPNGRILASGSDDHCIKLWDVAAGRECRSLRGHRKAVSGLAFSPDGKTLATCSFDKTVRLWNVSK
ncbi:MAG TPA: WD40 repeat domain-containing protein [Gemmataceae bacterium]|nr:WD40 repeat domain-containing protein [Gemmataceae bacterium]